MKRIVLFFAAAVMAVCSCNKFEDVSPVAVVEDGTGDVNVSLFDSGSLTKAALNTNEETLTSVQVFVFKTGGDYDGELYRYQVLSAEERTAKKFSVKNMKVGTYSIHVIANGPDMNGKVQNKKQLLEKHAIELGAYNGASTDFVMGGNTDDVIINADQTTEMSVTISRYVSRVTVAEIKNNLPQSFGTMHVNYCVLSNVVANQNLGGNEVVSTWYNKDCRADETNRDASHIIGTATYKASSEENTFAKYNQDVTNGNSITSPKYFYAYPNSLRNYGKGYENPFVPKATCLDLSVTFSVAGVSHTYYYNVPLAGVDALPGIARNYDYNVKIIISGEGEDEPGKYTEKGHVSAQIAIAPWSDGEPISMDI